MNLTMTASLRKLALTAHISFSVGLLGAIAAFLALAVAGLISEDARIVHTAYPAMDLIARFAIVPLAFAALLSGVVQSLGTSWGLFRHYWIVAKLLLTAFAAGVLVMKLELIRYAARLTETAVLPRSELDAAGTQLVAHAAGGLLVLLIPAFLSVYKPHGLTPYGRRNAQAQRTPSQPPFVSSAELAVPLNRRSSGTMPRPAYIVGIIALVLIVHVVIFHLTGAGVARH